MVKLWYGKQDDQEKQCLKSGLTCVITKIKI